MLGAGGCAMDDNPGRRCTEIQKCGFMYSSQMRIWAPFLVVDNLKGIQESSCRIFYGTARHMVYSLRGHWK